MYTELKVEEIKMKIRTDFVTNSSSSSYVTISVKTTDNKLYENRYYYENIGHSSLLLFKSIDLSEVVNKSNSIYEMLELLSTIISDGVWSPLSSYLVNEELNEINDMHDISRVVLKESSRGFDISNYFDTYYTFDAERNSSLDKIVKSKEMFNYMNAFTVQEEICVIEFFSKYSKQELDNIRFSSKYPGKLTKNKKDIQDFYLYGLKNKKFSSIDDMFKWVEKNTMKKEKDSFFGRNMTILSNESNLIYVVYWLNKMKYKITAPELIDSEKKEYRIYACPTEKIDNVKITTLKKKFKYVLMVSFVYNNVSKRHSALISNKDSVASTIINLNRRLYKDDYPMVDSNQYLNNKIKIDCNDFMDSNEWLYEHKDLWD